MSATGDPTPDATRRRHRWIGAFALLVLAAAVLRAALTEEPVLPTEVWVPAAAVGPAGDRRLLDDLRVAPGGDAVDEWRPFWAETAARQPCLYLRPPIPWTRSIPLFWRTDCVRMHGEGYAVSGEQRDADGVAWARLTLRDEDAIRAVLSGE